MSNDFWSVLFDDEDAICFGAKPTDTKVGEWRPKPEHCYFAINALHKNKDLQPTENWHSPNMGRRADCNVTKLRSFLLEFDSVPLDKQQALMEGVPHSTCVFSGGKSLHYIIALETPLANRAEYDAVVRRLHQAVPRADRSTKNPSRFSRTPNARRADNHVIQELVTLGQRVPNEKFFAWLKEMAPAQVRENTERAADWRPLGLSKFTKHFLAFGAEPGRWNQSLFNAACDLARLGWSEDMIVDRMVNITGLLDQSDRKSIKSAVTTCRSEYALLPTAD